MTVKTYRARSMQEALALVRQELGSQASVLHMREVRPRGLARLWSGAELIEVVASDNVSVPGRLPGSVPAIWQPHVPRAPSGIDLTELPGCDAVDTMGPNEQPRRLAAFLERGVSPLTGESEPTTAAGDIFESARTVDGAPLIVVRGATAGVGTSTVAWNIAQGLARHGLRTVWVGAASTRGGSVPHPVRREGSVVDVLAGRRTVHEVLTRGPGGVQCVPGGDPRHEKRPISGKDQVRCLQELQRLAPHAEVIVVDAGSAEDTWNHLLWDAAAAACIVVTPNDQTVLRGYSDVKKQGEAARRIPIGMFINRASAAEADAIAARFTATCREFLGLAATLCGSLPPCESPGKETGREPATCRVPELLFDRAAELLWHAVERASGASAAERASTTLFQKN